MPDVIFDIIEDGSVVDVVTEGSVVDSGVSTTVVDVITIEGPAGPQGPPGIGGFTAQQATPAATWTITNPLGRYPRAVSVFIGGELVEADVATPDMLTIVVTFATPQAGRAEIT